jgi:hypothetical protein
MQKLIDSEGSVWLGFSSEVEASHVCVAVMSVEGSESRNQVNQLVAQSYWRAVHCCCPLSYYRSTLISFDILILIL